jgi:hypothetical protein
MDDEIAVSSIHFDEMDEMDGLDIRASLNLTLEDI